MKEEIAARIRASEIWVLEDCAALCHLADMDAEWKSADGETFESVLYAAAAKLGVEIL